MEQTIPNSVLALFKQSWKDEGDFSFFDLAFQRKGRDHDPSYYFMRVGKELESDFDTFSYVEAKALVEEGAFGSLARARDDKIIVINEHAQHSLVDFYSDVYRAWRKHLSRVAKAEAKAPFPNDKF